MKVLSLLLLLGAFHGAFLFVVLISRRQSQPAANNFLAIIILIFSGYLFESFLLLEGLLTRFPHILAVFVPLFYLLGPLYYFYVKAMLNQRSRLSKKDGLHLVPAFLCFLSILPFYLQPAESKVSLITNVDPQTFRMPANRAVFYGVPLLQSGLYTVAAWRLLQKKRTHFDGRSLANPQVIQAWVRRFTIAFALFWLCFLIVYLLFIFTDFYLYYVRFALILLSAVLIHFVGYWTARESILVNRAASTRSSHEKYAGSTLSEPRAANLKNELLRLIETGVYRENKVTLADISKRLSANSQYLSQLVNRDFHCNFSDFINSFRIEEAKQLLRNQEFDHMSLLAIGLQVGFQNKNTFIRAFKRHTGQTPSEFRKAQA